MKPLLDRCPCGYEPDDPILLPKGRYTAWGWFLMCLGISSRPTRVDIMCPVCGALFKTITDPDERARYRFRA